MASRKRVPFGLKPGFRNQQKEESGAQVFQTLLKQARKSGQLNLSNRNLTDVPESVWRINLDTPEECKDISLGTTEERWWEQEDLTKLILASNTLTQISADIKLLPALSVLDVHDNRLTSLPEALGELSNLQKLNVSHNNLQALPECLGRLKTLQFLHAAHNQLADLDDSIKYLSNLEDVDLSNNKLQRLPEAIGYLSRVMKLNVANNELKVLPPHIGDMTGLRTLEATHNQLHTLPDELGRLYHLEQLYLRHNKLTYVPLLENCTALKELHLGNNNIKGLTPEHLEHLRAISVLDMRDNKVAVLPDEIVLLQGLQRLDLTNNDLSGLPYALGTLPNLKSIVLDGNPMKSIRRDIMMRGTNELKKYLCSRMTEDASGGPKQPTAVKSAVGQSGIIGGGEGLDAHHVQSSKVLDYCDKKAAEIPDEVWAVVEGTGVQSVNFSKNALTVWPQRLSLAEDSLQQLNLGFNRLSSIPPDVGKFQRLVFMDFRNNQLSSLPDELSSAQHVREVIISFNRFNQLPPVLYKLSKLEIILASDNQIRDLDAQALIALPQIATLDLQNNDIMTVPPELGNCTQLRSLLLTGNAFRQPRPAILAKGTIAILDYLRGRIPT